MLTVSKLEANILLVVPDEDISKATYAYDFYHEVQKQALDLRKTKIIIDLSGQSYVNSLFWSKIISLVQKVEKIILVGLSKVAAKTYEILGINMVCLRAASIEEGLKLAKSKSF